MSTSKTPVLQVLLAERRVGRRSTRLRIVAARDVVAERRLDTATLHAVVLRGADTRVGIWVARRESARTMATVEGTTGHSLGTFASGSQCGRLREFSDDVLSQSLSPLSRQPPESAQRSHVSAE